MENDKKRNLLLLALLGGGVIYLLYKRKPKVIAVGEVQEESSSGGGGGGGGGFIPIMPIPVPTPTPTPTPAPTPAPKPDPLPTFPTCKTNEMYNPATRKCEPIVIVKDTGTTSKPPSGGAGTSAGSGLPVLNPYDPCKSNGYGGTYDPVTNTCKLSPYCGGGTVKLDSNGKAIGCSVSIPSGTGSGGVVIGGNVSGNMPAGPIGGSVSIPFSGNMPLTLDNLLM
jgi:hypothetical protein